MTALLAGLAIVAISRETGFTLFGVILILIGGAWLLLARVERDS